MVTGGLQDEEEHKTRKAGVAGLAAGGDRRGGAGRAALYAVAHGESGGTSGRRGGQRRDGGERHGVRRPGDGHGAGQRELSEACRLPAGDSRPVERLYGKDFYTVSRGIV